MPEREKVGSTVLHFEVSPPWVRARMLRQKLELLEASARTAIRDAEQLLSQLDSPRRMVEILEVEARTAQDAVVVADKRAEGIRRALDLLDRDDMGAQEYADNVPEVVTILRALL